VHVGKHHRACELSVHLRHRHMRINRARGTVHGRFMIGRRGGCEMSSLPPQRVTAGSYNFSFGCQACVVGSFRVTRRRPRDRSGSTDALPPQFRLAVPVRGLTRESWR
jgi:hypothetical protein